MSTALKADALGPLPTVGQSVWFENLPSGPAEVCVEELVPPALRTDSPRFAGVEVAVRQGSQLEIFFSSGNVPCNARATVIPAPKGRGGGPWVLVRSVERLQRRAAVRVPAMLRVRVSGGDPAFEADVVSEDVSSTGILVRSATALPHVDGPLLVTLPVGATGVTLAARVVRVTRADAGDRAWKTALAFMGTSRDEEDALVRFVFERQRELRRREAGLS
ncbi:MAG: PilZ domain-containing protein [Thermoleophilia bacterium]|nr:PilZ domain-containing protein [Thermoleophilia bacterium]